MKPLTHVLSFFLFIVPSILFAQLPPGAPAGTYNAAPTTSGVFVNGDSLYAGNPGFESFSATTSPPAGVVTYKIVTVTERSQLFAVTGNGFGPSGSPFPSDPAFDLVVHPVDPNMVLANPLGAGVVSNETLTATQQIYKGAGATRFDSRFDLLLEPADGEGFILEPGQYFVSVQAFRGLAGDWAWSELRPSTAQSDVFWADGLGSILTPIIGQRLRGGQIAQTGVAAFDVWMTPTDDMGVCNSYRAGATGHTPVADRPYMLLADPYMQYEMHEEEEVACGCLNGSCSWASTGNSRFRLYDRTQGCAVVVEGDIQPFFNPTPVCQFIGLPSASHLFQIPGGGSLLIREQCLGSNLNGYIWPNFTFFSAATPTSPQC